MNFITESEWSAAEKFNGSDPIMRWRDVPEKEIFYVTSIEQKENPKFETHILHFMNKKEENFKVFCPSHFVAQIRRNRKQNERPYFVSHGLVTRRGSSIASFEISYKKESKNWELFDNTNVEYGQSS